jgi:glutamine synthetase
MGKKTSKPKAKKVQADKAAAPTEKVQKNGITQPGADNKCGQVWAACDKLKADEKDISFEALREALDKEIADATIRTQRQRWKTFHA